MVNELIVMEEEIKKDCLSCEWFRSYRDDYFDDEEPDDQGFCKLLMSDNAGKGEYCYKHSDDFEENYNEED